MTAQTVAPAFVIDYTDNEGRPQSIAVTDSFILVDVIRALVAQGISKMDVRNAD